MAENKRNLKELTDIYLNDDAAVREFDSIMADYKRKLFLKRTVAVAASLLILVCVGFGIKSINTTESYADITTIELLEMIGTLAESDVDEISCITAKPDRNCIIVTAEFKTGVTRTYIMKRGADGSSIELTAQNFK